MKILFCIKSLSSAAGGAERVICTICSELASRGDDVTILTFDHALDAPFYELDHRVKRINLGIGNARVPATLFETILRIYALRKTVLQEKPNIAVGFMHSMFIPLSFALVGTQIPVIGSEHITPDHYAKRHIQRLLLSISSFFLNRITVVSESVRLMYGESIRKKMVVIPNPITFTLSNELVDGKKSNIILAIGRLEPQKDHAVLIKAFSYLANDFPDWTLRINGEGSLRGELERLIASLDLESSVKLPGLRLDIDTEYQKSKIFVIPSYYESFGLVIAEAMFFGLPVVGFVNCPGVNEIINDEVTGILVKPGINKAQSLSFALRRLLLDTNLREAMGSYGKLEINKYPSTKDIVDIWQSTLSSNISDSNKITNINRGQN